MSIPKIQTPDFEFYSMETKVSVAIPKDDHVEVKWDDGCVSRFHFVWLKDNDASENSIDSVSRERTKSIHDLSLDVKSKAVSVSQEGGLIVDWQDGSSSHYHPGWLKKFDYDGATKEPNPNFIKTWGRALEDELPLFSAQKIFDDIDYRYDFLNTIRVRGIAIVTDMQSEIEYFEKIATQIGLLRDMNWGRIFEIRPTDEGKYIANRGIALDLHNDAPTREYIPGFQIFQCVTNTCIGGESFWVDGYHIASVMRERYPDEFDILCTIPVHYADRSEKSKYSWTAPIFSLDHNGDIYNVRDITWLREPLNAEYNKTADWYSAYKIYNTLKSERKYQVERKLEMGDVAIVDNRRVLHGRRAFDDGIGERHIRTAYGERDELMSSIKIIERARDKLRHSKQLTIKA